MYARKRINPQPNLGEHVYTIRGHYQWPVRIRWVVAVGPIHYATAFDPKENAHVSDIVQRVVQSFHGPSDPRENSSPYNCSISSAEAASYTANVKNTCADAPVLLEVCNCAKRNRNPAKDNNNMVVT